MKRQPVSSIPVDLLANLFYVPFVWGNVYWGLWNQRYQLLVIAETNPIYWSIGVFGCGFGLGLLLASAFSTFWLWWAIGASIVAVAVLIAIVLVIRTPREKSNR